MPGFFILSQGYWTKTDTKVVIYLHVSNISAMGKTPFLGEEKAWIKIKHFCNYRERCHFEVKQQLFGMGLAPKQVEMLICRLIEEGLLNEQRFAKMYAGGHFRQKKWGKLKIIQALRLKKVSEPVIKKALNEIETVDYAASLQKLAAAKWASLKGQPYITRQAKTFTYLQQKGYEAAVVREAILAVRDAKEG